MYLYKSSKNNKNRRKPLPCERPREEDEKKNYRTGRKIFANYISDEECVYKT